MRRELRELCGRPRAPPPRANASWADTRDRRRQRSPISPNVDEYRRVRARRHSPEVTVGYSLSGTQRSTPEEFEDDDPYGDEPGPNPDFIPRPSFRQPGENHEADTPRSPPGN